MRQIDQSVENVVNLFTSLEQSNEDIRDNQTTFHGTIAPSMETNSSHNSQLNDKEIGKWALKFRISHSALNHLLNLLRNAGHKNLPKDARTLLNTPRKVSIVSFEHGKYWHNGLRSSLNNILTNTNEIKDIALSFNIDGIPIGKSSKDQFWPILGQIDNMREVKPFVVGIYAGITKPTNLEQFLRPFVVELSEIVSNGLQVNGHDIEVKINCFICDTPARALVKGKFALIFDIRKSKFQTFLIFTITS